jgi:hypothetical protein
MIAKPIKIIRGQEPIAIALSPKMTGMAVGSDFKWLIVPKIEINRILARVFYP